MENEYFYITFVVPIIIMLILNCTICELCKRKPWKMTFNKNEKSDFVYNTDCPICFNILVMPIVSECGHGFCIDCLHTFSMKNSWNNLCPLCRQLLKNLKLLENENYNYSVTKRQKLLVKIAEISKSPERFVDILTSRTACYASYGTLLLLLWTWAIVNIDTIFHYCMLIYGTFYEIPIDLLMHV